jgi:capsular polysaccharide biosynthesis protein
VLGFALDRSVPDRRPRRQTTPEIIPFLALELERRGRRRSILRTAALALCVLLSALAGGIAYAVSRSLPKTYQASGTIRVGVPTQAGISDSSVDAANDLTLQYAQLVGSNPVAAIAAARLKVDSPSLRGKLTGSSVSGQNILMVTASGRTPGQASSRAGAGVNAVQVYLTQQTSRQNRVYVSGLLAKIRAVDAAGVSAGPQAAAQADSQQDNALYEALRDAAGNQPTFQIVNAASGPAAQVEPKPKLYAIVAFVVVLLLSLRVAFVTMRPGPE